MPRMLVSCWYHNRKWRITKHCFAFGEIYLCFPLDKSMDCDVSPHNRDCGFAFRSDITMDVNKWHGMCHLIDARSSWREFTGMFRWERRRYMCHCHRLTTTVKKRFGTNLIRHHCERYARPCLLSGDVLKCFAVPWWCLKRLLQASVSSVHHKLCWFAKLLMQSASEEVVLLDVWGWKSHREPSF